MDYLTPNEVRTLKSGALIQTIKEVRERTGLGLRDSKDLVDRYADALGLFTYQTCYACQGAGRVRVRNGG